MLLASIIRIYHDAMHGPLNVKMCTYGVKLPAIRVSINIR